MALVKFSPLVSGVSGKVGGVVFSRTVGGSAVRSWAKGTNPNTEGQLLQRARLSQLSTVYGQLTPAQRQSFVDAANLAEHKVTNRLGEASNLTGPQFFNKVNLLLLAAGLPLITEYSGYWEAPQFSIVPDPEWDTNPTLGEFRFGVAYQEGWVPFGAPGISEHVLCIKVSRPTPPGRKSQAYRNVIALDADSPEVTVDPVKNTVAVVIPAQRMLQVFGEQPADYNYSFQVLALSPTHPWDQSVEKISGASTVRT